MTESYIKLFVYGTLLPNGVHHERIKDFVLCSYDAEIEGEMYEHFCASYPILVEGNDIIKGSILVIDEAAIPKVDLIEGCIENEKDSSLYTREFCMTVEGDNAIVYRWSDYNRAFKPDNFKRIRGGDWNAHLASRVPA